MCFLKILIVKQNFAKTALGRSKTIKKLNFTKLHWL